MTHAARLELICPAGTPAALRDAVAAGADAVYCGFRDATNARNFPGLNFTIDEMRDAVAHAHARGTKVLLALNTFPPAGKFDLWREAVDAGVGLGVDALIVADIGVAAYASRRHPGQRLHLSVQAAAASPEAVRYYCEEFGIRRVVLPRILTTGEIRDVVQEIPCEIETFVFGNHGLMVEGHCSLTNYVTGLSTNMDGVCSPAGQVTYERDNAGRMTSRLGEFAIDSFSADEKAGYPTICKGRYRISVRDDAYYAFEEPVGLNLTGMIGELVAAGVHAFKIEGRQRSRAYVQQVVSAFRAAIDAALAGHAPAQIDLAGLTEGQKQSEGAFRSKRWR